MSACNAPVSNGRWMAQGIYLLKRMNASRCYGGEKLVVSDAVVMKGVDCRLPGKLGCNLQICRARSAPFVPRQKSSSPRVSSVGPAGTFISRDCWRHSQLERIN